MVERIRAHLRRSLRTDSWIDVGLSIGAFAGGAVILFFVYQGFYMGTILFAERDDFDELRIFAHVVAACAVISLIVWDWIAQQKLFDVLDREISFGEVTLGMVFFSTGFLPFFLARNPAGSVHVVASIILSGPRLLRAGIGLARRGFLRWKTDFDGCARILALALDTESRVPLEEIRDRLPDIDLARAVEELTWLPGVVFIRNAPPGIVLTESLRAELDDAVLTMPGSAGPDAELL